MDHLLFLLLFFCFFCLYHSSRLPHYSAVCSESKCPVCLVGDRIHCCCRPSFRDNVIMGGDSWQLRFLSAQIFYYINNERHSPAMSATAQWAHDCILMCPLVPPPRLFLLTSPPSSHSFYLFPIYLDFDLLRPVVSFSHRLHSHLYVLLLISVFSFYTNVFVFILLFFFSDAMTCQMKHKSEWGSLYLGTRFGLKTFFFFFPRTAWVQFSVNIVIFHDIYSDASINAQMIWPMFTRSQTEPL